MNTVDFMRVAAIIILFGLLWNVSKAWLVERNPRIAAGMDFIYS